MKKLFLLLFALFSNFCVEPPETSSSCKVGTSHIIDGLNIIVPYFNPTLKIMSYNIDKSHREEQHENTKWINRMSFVRKMINKVGADIVCLQELREVANTPTDQQFLSGFEQYRFILQYRNPSFISPNAPLETSFAQAILYDFKKMFPLQSFQKWLSDTPDMVSDSWSANPSKARGATVLCVQFQLTDQGRIVKNRSPFWVFNVHFELSEPEKTKSCYKLLEIIKEVAKDQPYIVCGDFNFFPTNFIKTAQGEQQRKILTDQMQDLGKGAVTSQKGKKLEGTFVGYEHDQFKAELNEVITRTDHIFASNGVEPVGNAILHTETMRDKEPEELTTRNLPSDHLPLSVDIKLFGK